MNYSLGLHRVATMVSIGIALANFLYAVQGGLLWAWMRISSGMVIQKYFGNLMVAAGLGPLPDFWFVFVHTLLILVFSRFMLYMVTVAVLWVIAGFRKSKLKKQGKG